MSLPSLSIDRRKACYRVLVAIVAGMTLWLASATSVSAQEVEPTAPSAFAGLTSKLNPANWKMPSFGKMLMPQANEQDRIIERKDSLVDEVAGSAKNSWQRTKAALNPMKLMPAGNKTPTEKAEKPGFFSRLFSPPSPKQSAGTVNDWLKQDRVQP